MAIFDQAPQENMMNSKHSYLVELEEGVVVAGEGLPSVRGKEWRSLLACRGYLHDIKEEEEYKTERK